MKTVIIGLGNPVLTDDALGIKAAEMFRKELSNQKHVEIVEAYTGGLGLMELMVGFDRAIVVDAVTTRVHPPGTLMEMNLDDLINTRNTTSTHDSSLAVALETGQILGLKLPKEIFFYGIETAETNDFGEELTAHVRNTLPALMRRVLMTLDEEVLT